LFKDLEDADSEENKKFNPLSPQGKQLLAFLQLAKKHNFVYNLLLIINA